MRAQTTGRASGTDYRAIFDAVSDAILIHDPETGGILDVNQRMCEMFGYSHQEALRLNVMDLCGHEPPCSQDKLKRLLAESASGESDPFKWLAITAEGRPFWVEVHLKRTRLGGQERVLAVVRDISRRVQSEEELRRTKETLEALIQASPVPILDLDLTGRVQLWNPAAERLFGWRANEAMGKVPPFVGPEEQEEFLTLFQEEIKGQGVDGLEIRRRRQDGTYLDLSLSTAPLYDSQGRIASIMGLLVDITHRKEAEATLKESEERLRLVTESSLAGVYLIQDGRFRYVNRVLAQTFGYGPEEIIDRLGPLDLVHPTDLDLVADNIRRRLAREEDKVHYNFLGLRRDGSMIHCEVLSRYVEYRGRPAIMGTLLDITERVRTEEALKRSETRYRAIVEDQTEMVARITPDFTISFLNETGCRSLEKKPEEVVGESFLPFIHEEDRPRLIETMAHLTRENPLGSIELRSIAPDGQIRWEQWSGRAIFDEDGNLTEFQAVGRDVTDRRLAEEALRGQKNLLDTVFTATPDLLVLKDRNFVFQAVNPAFCRFLGKTGEEIIGRTDFDLFPREEAQRYRRDDEQVLMEGASLARDEEVSGAAGKKWLQVIKTVVRDEQGVPSGILCSVTDISLRKQAEEALREISNTLQTLFKATPLAIVVLDHDYLVRAWNPAAERIFGWTAAEVMGGKVPIIPEDEWPKTAIRIRGELRGEMRSALELRRLKKDGTLIDVSLWTAPLRNARGQIVASLGIMADISDRKQAEAALQASEANYRTIFNAANDAIAVVDLDTGNFLDVNKKWCEMTGFSPEEARGLNVAALCVEDEPGFVAGEAIHKIKQAVMEGPQLFQWLAQTKDGRRHWVEVNLARTLFNNQYRLLTVVRDISERKQAEEVLRASEAKYRTLVEQIPAVTYMAALDDVTSHIYISPQIETVLGFSQEEWLANPESYRDRIHPEDRDRVLSESILSYSQGGPFVSEYRMLAKSGRAVWWRDESRAVYDADGCPLFMQGVALDITARKEAEEALRQSEARFRGVFEGAAIGIALVDLERLVLKSNRAFREMSGYNEEEMHRLSAAEVTHPDDWAADQGRFTELLAGKRDRYQIEKRYRHRQGHWFWVRLNVTLVRDAAGAPQFAITMVEDITQRRRMEEALRKVSRALKAITECHQAMLRASKEKELLKEVCRIIVEVGGYLMAWVGFAEHDEARTVRPVAQKGFDAGYLQDLRIVWSDNSWGRGPTGRAIRTGKPAVCRDTGTDPRFAPWRAQAQERGYASILALPLKDSQTFGALTIYASEPNAFDVEEINLLMGLANDLAYGISALRTNTERRRAEAALRESEEKYRGLMDYSSDAILLADLDGNLTDANRRAEELLGYTKEELLKMRYTRLHPPEHLDEIVRTFQGIIKAGLSQTSESAVLRKDGAQVPVDITGSLIEYAGKKVAQGIFRDITERQKAEAALRDSELKLRLLTSQLLTIQERERRRVSRELHDELGQALTVLKIHLVAIENKLRRDQQGLKANCEQLLNYIDQVIENVRRLSWDLSPSILEDLGLSSSLGYLIDETCRNNNLSCSVAMDSIDHLFSAETRINIYRIFQESLTNVVKHAQATHISVAVKKKGDQVSFVILDNGRGFDQEKVLTRDVSKRGLGLTAMNERALMARGSLSILSKPDQGTRISFSIPMDN